MKRMDAMQDAELDILIAMRDQAERLLRSDDLLMVSQYRHLHGRITALIAAKGAVGQYTRQGQETDHATQ